MSRAMSKPTDVRPVGASLFFLPIKTRVPLKFGPEVTTECTCARVRLTVADAQAGRARLRVGIRPRAARRVRRPPWRSDLPDLQRAVHEPVAPSLPDRVQRHRGDVRGPLSRRLSRPAAAGGNPGLAPDRR